MTPPPTVFLSAASLDLAGWRDQLHDVFTAAGFMVYTQEKSLGAAPRDVHSLLTDAVTRSQFVIHLAGRAYGSHADSPFPEQPGFQCSWTQFEYYLAHQLGKDVFAFVCEDAFPCLSFTEAGTPAERSLKESLQQAHRARLVSGKFDGTPVAGLKRTLNKTLDSQFALLKAVAECVRSIADSAHQPQLAEAAAALSARATLHTIPPPPVHFTGRTADLEKLRALPASGRVHLTGLRGMGGIGKTALARVLASGWAASFPDAQLEINARGTDPAPPTAAELLAQVIHAFHPDARLPEDTQALRDIFLSLLSGKRALLLLDNARDAAQAAPLLPPAGCALIVTSRWTFDIGGQSPVNVDRLSDADSLLLLRELHPALPAEAAQRIVQLCGGLPLALRLAGSFLARDAARRHGTADVAGYLRDLEAGPLGRLDHGAEKAGETPIQETLRLSEAALTPAQRDAWRALGVFTAPFDQDAATAVAGATPDIIDELLDSSLLDATGPSLRLHDLAAEYTRAALTPAALHTHRLAHARHFIDVGEKADTLYMEGGENVTAGLALFDAARPHLESAFAWLASHPTSPEDAAPGQSEIRIPKSAFLLVSLVGSIVYTGQSLRFHPRQCITWLEAQSRAARLTGDRQAEGVALGNLGIAHADLGDARRALECYEQRMAIAQEIGDRRGEGNAWGNMGNAHAALGDARRALECHEQARLISREIGNRRGEGSDWGNMGLAHAALGDARRALECHEQAMLISRETGDRRGEGQAWGSMGNAHRHLGDARRALECYEQGLVISREIGDRRGEGSDWGGMGNAHKNLGDARRALECYEQWRTIAREIGDRRGEANALFNSAVALWNLAGPGERDEARRRMAAAAAHFEAMEDPNAAQARAVLAMWGS